MEVLENFDDKRPRPELDEVSRDFWQGAAQGNLLIQRCASCEQPQFYPRAICQYCAATSEWDIASGRGGIHTFTVIRQFHAQPFRDELPYVVAIIDLEEGVRVMANITDFDVDAVSIGKG